MLWPGPTASDLGSIWRIMKSSLASKWVRECPRWFACVCRVWPGCGDGGDPASTQEVSPWRWLPGHGDESHIGGVGSWWEGQCLAWVSPAGRVVQQACFLRAQRLDSSQWTLTALEDKLWTEFGDGSQESLFIYLICNGLIYLLTYSFIYFILCVWSMYMFVCVCVYMCMMYACFYVGMCVFVLGTCVHVCVYTC